jgi:hypothetical protein
MTMKIKHLNGASEAKTSGVQSPPETPGAAARPPSTEVMFSVEDDYVSASWPGSQGSLGLGTYAAVKEAMSDFLAQCAVGERLLGLRGCPDAA